MGMTDRLGDKMQTKLHEYQMAQVARQAHAHNVTASLAVSPRQKPKTANAIVSSANKGFICGSSVFQEVAAFSSGYDAQVLAICFRTIWGAWLLTLLDWQIARDNFHRKNMFDAEEAQYRDQLDIFGNPKLPSPTNSSRNAVDPVVSGSRSASLGRGTTPISRSSYGNSCRLYYIFSLLR